MKLRQAPRAKLSTKQVVRITTTFCFLFVLAFIVAIQVSDNRIAHAAASGDYRSKTSGSWATASNWEMYNGATWATAVTAPTSANGVIEILSGHSMTVSANVTVDQVLVDAGGTLTVSSNTLTIANGTGTDLDVSGTLTQSGGTISVNASALLNINNGGIHNNNGGTLTLTGSMAVNNGGTYVHNRDGVTVPTATWGATSTLKITGIVSSSLTGTYQDFGNVIYNCTGQTCCTGFGAGSTIEIYDNFKNIAGDFTVQSTGSGGMWLFRTAATAVISGNYIQTGGTMFMSKGANCTMTVNGNFNLSGGTFVEAERYSSPTLTVYGNMNLSGGTFNHSCYQASTSGEGIGTVNLYGNYVNTGTTHTETATNTGRGEFNFTKSGTQTFSIATGTITNTINFTVVSGAVVDLSTYAVTGAGTFTLSSGGGLILASTAGITSSGATGNVQVTGTRSFSTGADYTYDATAAQVTGNGLPATVRNITFDNTSNVTMSGSSSATGIITLTNGKVITGNYELGTTNTSTTSIVGYTSSKYVVGNLRRSVSATGSYDYPVGDMTYYELANLNFTGKSGFTSVVGSFVHYPPIDQANYPLEWNLRINGSRVLDVLNYGYWILTPDASMTGGTYAVTLKEQGHTNSAPDPRYYGVLKRPNATSYWQSIGTHDNSTQSEIDGVATAVRSDLAAFSHFAIGIGEGVLPITLVSFKAQAAGNAVKLSWATANEINNDYFTIERSDDGKNFTPILNETGAGNSTSMKHYSVRDEQPIDGMNYYRLKQTDFDGHYTYSETETVQFDQHGTDKLVIVSVSPNPFTSDFRVNYKTKKSGTAEINLMNSSGTLIRHESMPAERGMNTWDFLERKILPTGIYYVYVMMDGESASQKIIKN